jgi:hypothetical protein
MRRAGRLQRLRWSRLFYDNSDFRVRNKQDHSALSLMAIYLEAGAVLAALSAGIFAMNLWHSNHRSRLTKGQREREDREDEREATLW